MEKNLELPIFSNRTYALPKDFHAYCVNKPCGYFLIDIPFGRLLFIQDMANLKKDVAELKQKQQVFIDLLIKAGVISEDLENQEVDKKNGVE